MVNQEFLARFLYGKLFGGDKTSKDHRRKKATTKEINENMFNLISSINIKYFDDIIIKDFFFF